MDQVLKMTETTYTKNWYVVRSIGGRENKVKSYIENEIRRLELEDYVDEVLVPTEKVIQIRNGKKVSKERVYFPGYIMIKAEERRVGKECRSRWWPYQ